MATKPTGANTPVAYTQLTDCEAELPVGFVLAGSPGAGVVVQSDIDRWVGEIGQRLDGKLWNAGFQTPFPAITDHSGPGTPQLIQRIAQARLIARIRCQLVMGNRQDVSSSGWEKAADDLEADLISNPNQLGYVSVTTPENVFVQMGSGSPPTEAGLTFGPFYRLQNRNVRANSLRFVTAANIEVERPGGGPFLQGCDWQMRSLAEGLVDIYNASQIQSTVGPGGGVIYAYGWRRLDFGRCTPTLFPGVSRL